MIFEALTTRGPQCDLKWESRDICYKMEWHTPWYTFINIPDSETPGVNHLPHLSGIRPSYCHSFTFCWPFRKTTLQSHQAPPQHTNPSRYIEVRFDERLWDHWCCWGALATGGILISKYICILILYQYVIIISLSKMYFIWHHWFPQPDPSTLCSKHQARFCRHCRILTCSSISRSHLKHRLGRRGEHGRKKTETGAETNLI